MDNSKTRKLRVKFPFFSYHRRHLKTIFLTIFAFSTFFYLLLRHRSLSLSSSSSSDPQFTTSISTTISTSSPTTLRHLLFSIASSSVSLLRRKPYLKLWYNPNTTRALLFLDSRPSINPNLIGLPPAVISGDTSRFPYTFRRGQRSAIRIARTVKEAVDRDEPDVRWFVFGDDDTLFFTENLVRVLAKYDHQKWYYIGSNSESLDQNLKMSFDMAYGGGGFAISFPLAKALARVLDSCLMRYPHLYGSDSRISACIAELGVGLTKEPGFHQLDVRGDLFGMLTAHPLSPLLSLHHMEVLEPIFPNMDRIEALQHLFRAVNIDPARILQQTVCYDRPSNITISVVWGYVVQIFEGNQLLPDILASQRTFRPWKRGSVIHAGQFVIDTRDSPRDHCRRPVDFFLEDVALGTGRVWSKYKRYTTRQCPKANAVDNVKNISVYARKLQQDIGQVLAPRRQCCDIIHPFGRSMIIDIRHCGFDELIAMDA